MNNGDPGDNDRSQPDESGDLLLYTGVSQRFPDVYRDGESGKVCFKAPAPPLGELKIYLNESAFKVGVTPMPWSEALAKHEEESFFNRDSVEASKCLPVLSNYWDVVWPGVYEALEEFREGFEQELTAADARFTLHPGSFDEHFEFEPLGDGYDPNAWVFNFEMADWDGYFGIQFTLDGKVHHIDVEY